MIGQLRRTSQRQYQAPQITPQAQLFVLWMLGWAVGLMLFGTTSGRSPVLLAYLLVMLTSGVWAVGLSMLPHLPRIPASRRRMPKPLNVIPLDESRRRQTQQPRETIADECYYMCSDGTLVPIEDESVLQAIEASDKEMHRRQ